MVFTWFKIDGTAYPPTAVSWHRSKWVTWQAGNATSFIPIDLSQEYESIYRAQDSMSAYPMTTRQISRRKREEDDQDDEDIQFQYVMLHFPNVLN